MQNIIQQNLDTGQPWRLIMNYVSLIIPCYNEETRIPAMLEHLLIFDKAWGAPFEVILVDDGSSDHSPELLNNVKQEDFSNATSLQVIISKQNKGKGHALKLGIQVAEGDWILTLDADMATSPLEMRRWLKQLPNNTFPKDTILIGSRQHEHSKVDALESRKVIGNIYNKIIRTFTPIQEKDTQCGFKLYPKLIGKELFSDLQINGWAHDIEILIKAHLRQIPIRSMPVEWKHVDNEKINVVTDGFKMFWQTIYISYRLKWQAFKSKVASSASHNNQLESRNEQKID